MKTCLINELFMKALHFKELLMKALLSYRLFKKALYFLSSFQMYSFYTVKTVFTQKALKMVFKMDNRLMQVKSMAECSPWSILQYFRPALNYHPSLRLLFCLFLSGCLRQVYCIPIHFPHSTQKVKNFIQC